MEQKREKNEERNKESDLSPVPSNLPDGKLSFRLGMDGKPHHQWGPLIVKEFSHFSDREDPSLPLLAQN